MFHFKMCKNIDKDWNVFLSVFQWCVRESDFLFTYKKSSATLCPSSEIVKFNFPVKNDYLRKFKNREYVLVISCIGILKAILFTSEYGTKILPFTTSKKATLVLQRW